MDSPVIGITPSNNTEEGPRLADRPLLLLAMDYIRAVEEAGGRAVVLPLHTTGAAPPEILDVLDGLLVPGSYPPLPRSLREQPALPGLREQAPLRYDSDVSWIRGALARRLPVLAICRGMQTLNEVLGGTIWPRLYPPEEMGRHSQLAPGHQPWHEVRVEPGSLLARALGKEAVWTNSFHVQGVRKPGTGLRISARSLDGVIEAIEGSGTGFLLGVQFHPELQREIEPAFRGIFREFIRAAQEVRVRRRQAVEARSPQRPTTGSAGGPAGA